jgi:hypothetical protein
MIPHGDEELRVDEVHLLGINWYFFEMMRKAVGGRLLRGEGFH